MLVEPEVTVVGPTILTVGTAVPVLWQRVQVVPLFPEKPEIPIEDALAEDEKQIIMASTAKNKIIIELRVDFTIISPCCK